MPLRIQTCGMEKLPKRALDFIEDYFATKFDYSYDYYMLMFPYKVKFVNNAQKRISVPVYKTNDRFTEAKKIGNFPCAYLQWDRASMKEEKERKQVLKAEAAEREARVKRLRPHKTLKR